MRLEPVSKIGYHGTDEEGKDGIVSDGFTIGKINWLGKGIYFYEAEASCPHVVPKSGLTAVREYKRNEYIFKSHLCLLKLLDLVSNSEHQLYYEQTIDKIKKEFTENKKPVPQSAPLIALDLMKKKLSYSSVRAMVKSKKDGYIQIPGPVELCVQDLKEIQSIDMM